MATNPDRMRQAHLNDYLQLMKMKGADGNQAAQNMWERYQDKYQPLDEWSEQHGDIQAQEENSRQQELNRIMQANMQKAYSEHPGSSTTTVDDRWASDGGGEGMLTISEAQKEAIDKQVEEAQEHKDDAWNGFLNDAQQSIDYLNNVYDNRRDGESFGAALSRNDNATEYLKDKGYIDEDYNPVPVTDDVTAFAQAVGIEGRQNHDGWDWDPTTGTLIDYRIRSTGSQDARSESVDEATARREANGETIVPTMSKHVETEDGRVKLDTEGDDLKVLANMALETAPALYSYISNLRNNLASSNADYVFTTDDGQEIRIDDIIGRDLDKYIDDYLIPGGYNQLYYERPDLDNVTGYSRGNIIYPRDIEEFEADPSNYNDFVTIGTLTPENNSAEVINDLVDGYYDSDLDAYRTASGIDIPIDKLSYVGYDPDYNYTVDADDPTALMWTGANNFTSKSGITLTPEQVWSLLGYDTSSQQQAQPNVTNVAEDPLGILTTEPNTMTDDEGNFDLGRFIQYLPANTVNLGLSTAPLIMPGKEAMYAGMLADSAINGVDPFSYELDGTYDYVGSQDAGERLLGIADTALNTYGEKLFGLGQSGKIKNLIERSPLPSTNNINNRYLRGAAQIGKQSVGEGFEEVLQDTAAQAGDHWGANQLTEIDENGNEVPVYDSEGKPVYDDDTSSSDRFWNTLNQHTFPNFIGGAYLGGLMNVPGGMRTMMGKDASTTAEAEPTGSSRMLTEEEFAEILRNLNADRELRVRK